MDADAPDWLAGDSRTQSSEDAEAMRFMMRGSLVGYEESQVEDDEDYVEDGEDYAEDGEELAEDGEELAEDGEELAEDGEELAEDGEDEYAQMGFDVEDDFPSGDTEILEGGTQEDDNQTEIGDASSAAERSERGEVEAYDDSPAPPDPPEPEYSVDLEDLVVQADTIQAMGGFLRRADLRNVVVRGAEAVRIIAASPDTPPDSAWITLLEALEATRSNLSRVAQAEDMMLFFLGAMKRLKDLNPESVQSDKTVSRRSANDSAETSTPRPLVDLSGSRHTKLEDLVDKPLDDVRRMLPSEKQLKEYDSRDGGWSDPVDARELSETLLKAVRALEKLALDSPLATVLVHDTQLGDTMRKRVQGLWRVMRLVLHRNRSFQETNADGGQRRVRPAAFISAEQKLDEISRTMLLVAGKLDLDLDGVKQHLLVVKGEIEQRTLQRVRETYVEEPEKWVQELSQKLYKIPEEQLRISQWAALRGERVQKAQERAVQNSVALVAVVDYLKLIEERITDRDEAERQRTEARRVAREQKEASAKAA